MEVIRTTLERLVKSWQNKQICDGGGEDLEKILKKILTKREQKHIKYYSLKDQRFVINVDSSAWLYVLSLKKTKLLKNLNQGLNCAKAITEVVVRLSAD